MKMTRLVCAAALLLTLLLGACALAEAVPEITLEQIIAANAPEKVLAMHDSMLCEMAAEDEQFSLYQDAEMYYYEEPLEDMAEVCTADTGYYRIGEQYIGNMRLEQDSFFQPLLDEGLLEVREITGIVREGEFLVISVGVPGEDEEEDVVSMNFEYVIAEDTLLIQSITEIYTFHASGIEDISVYTMKYDVERPANAQALLDRLAQAENLRTVTIVMDPLTDEERTVSFSAVKGDMVIVDFPVEYEEALYKDPECTQHLGEIDPNADMQSYVRKLEA